MNASLKFGAFCIDSFEGILKFKHTILHTKRNTIDVKWNYQKELGLGKLQEFFF